MTSDSLVAVAPPSYPLRFVLVALAGWINQRQRDVVDYLQEKNRALREQLGPGRLPFTDDQRRRLAANALLERELASNRRVVGLNKCIYDYKNLLISIQKIRFDLGLDEYRRGFPPATASAPNVTCADGTMEERVCEAVAIVEEIFDRRGIPR
jgi:hypothetical protein